MYTHYVTVIYIWTNSNLLNYFYIIHHIIEILLTYQLSFRTDVPDYNP